MGLWVEQYRFVRKAILLGVRSNIGGKVKQYSFVAPLQALVATEGRERAESVREEAYEIWLQEGRS